MSSNNDNNNNNLDVDALLEESLNKEISNREVSNEKKRNEPEDSSELERSSSDDKRRRSSEREYSSRDRDYRDRDYSSRDRDYRDRDYRSSDRDRYDRDYGRDRDYRSSDRDRYDRDYGRDSYGRSSDRDRDRSYDRDSYSSSSSSSRSSRDYGRDSYGRSSDRDRDRSYDRDSYSKDRDRDSSSSSKSKYSSESSSSRDRHSETNTTNTSSGSSSTTTSTSSNRDSKEKSSSSSSSTKNEQPSSPSSSSSSSIKESKLSDSNGLPEPDEESDQRTVFVSKLSQNIVEKDLFDLFSQAGTVLNVRLITDKVTKRMKGVGYVEFSQKDMVDRAIALTGSRLDGQSILVHPIQPEKKVTKVTGSGESRIYVGYIHLNVQEEQIRTIFQPYGEIDFINIHTKPGISKYAFIQFKTTDSARKAIAELNGYELMGKNLKLNMVSQEKNSNGTYVQIPQINNIIHHNYTPNPIYNAAAAAVAQLQHQGFPINPYVQQQAAAAAAAQQQILMMQQHHQHHPHHPHAMQLAQQQQFQAQIQAHLQATNAQTTNNSNQHTFKENNALSSLDEDDGGIPLTAQGRALLTAKLQGKNVSPPSNSNINAININNNNNNNNIPTPIQTGIIVPYTQLPIFPFSSSCLILRNMFDPETETEENWDKDITDETHAECSTFGKILHIYLDKNTKGCIYIRFDNTESPLKAIQKLHGRWFSKKQIIAELIPEPHYNLKFPASSSPSSL